MHKFVALFFSLAAAITTILTSTSYAVAQFCSGVVSRISFEKILQIILLPAFFFISLLKKVLCNHVIRKIFRDSLASLFGRLAPWRWKRLQRPHSGVILVLIVLFIPIILGGIKYTEYLFERRWEVLEAPDSNHVTKQCAKEAALAVARNYNPGLTLAQQKEALYKVADYIYNHTLSSGNSVLTRAIPGIHIKTKNSDQVTSIEKFVSYTTAPKYLLTLQSTKSDTSDESSFEAANYHTLWLCADKSTDSLQHRQSFDEVDTKILPYTDCMLIHEDFFSNPSVDSSGFGYTILSATSSFGSSTGYNPADIFATYGISQTFSASSSENGTYSIRSTGSDAQCVEISIAEDADNLGKIKVRTDDDIAYAVPASCNVDVVFAIPTNSAACRCTGNDATTSSIHQMAQACREFIKDHFFNTRGVYMSLIPYSGKLSISPDRLQDWTIAFPKYTVDPEQIFLMGACLYSTTGLKDAALSQDSYDWGSAQSGYPIMFRAGVAQSDAKYNNNPYFTGFLFDSSAPSTSDSYKYLRQNLNPCHIEHANLEQGLCTNDCPKYLANPYYMIEPTTDVTKIYEMLAALLPFSDPHNASNFIFPVFEWVNNFFQGWTRDPGRNATSGGSDSEAAQLGSQSKTTKNRKKAIILLVNKPDWFEPGEMTYLGSYNDYQELHTQSDTIDFSIDFSDKSKKFVDGTPYDGTIMGHKKLLQFEGTSTRDSAYYVGDTTTECALKFPHKALVRLKVEQISADKEGSLQFTNLAVSKEGVAVNNDKYCVTTPMEFYVEADQLSEPEEADGFYHLNFEASNVRFLRADITNRRYSKYLLTKRAKDSISETDTTLTNVVEIAVIKTTTKKPIQLKMESVGPSSITLDGVTYDNITAPMTKTFTNRGARVSDAYSEDFVPNPNTQNLNINIYLKNQKIFPKIDRIYHNQLTKIFDESDFYQIKNGQVQCVVHVGTNELPFYLYINSELVAKSEVDSNDQGTWVISDNIGMRTENVCDRYITYGFNSDIVMDSVEALSVNGYYHAGAPFDKTNSYILNLDTVPFGTCPNANCVYLENGYLKYWGRGDLTVEVTPQLSKIKHQRPDGSSVEHIYTNTAPEIITLDPNEYLFEKGDDDYYYVTLELTNVKSLTTVIMEENFFEILDPTATEADQIVEIKTTTKRPIRLKAESRGPSSITLDGVTYDNITAPMTKTFTNRGARVSGAYSEDFVPNPNTQNLNINIYLKNQKIFPKIDRIYYDQLTKIFDESDFYQIKNGQVQCVVHVGTNELPFYLYINSELVAKSEVDSNDQGTWVISKKIKMTTEDVCDRYISYRFNSDIVMHSVEALSVNSYYRAGAPFDKRNSYILNLDTVPFGTDPNANCVYLENGYFKYWGRGDLIVTVTPVIYIKYTHPDGTEKKIDYGKVGTHSMTVDPEQFKYEGNGPYTIRFQKVGITKVYHLRAMEKRIVFEFWDDSEARDSAGNTVLRNYLENGFTENSSTNATRATKLSADKMKATWGTNLRVYILKYKPELSYEEGGETKNFDYSTVDACASDGGKVYEAKNAEELKATFEMIWEDLQEWTGYQEAKVVN